MMKKAEGRILLFNNLIIQVSGILFSLYMPYILDIHIYGEYQKILAWANLFLVFTITGISKSALKESQGSPEKFAVYSFSYNLIRNLFSIVAVVIFVFISAILNQNFIPYLLFAFFLPYKALLSNYVALFQVNRCLHFSSTINLGYSLIYYVLITLVVKLLGSLNALVVTLVVLMSLHLLILEIISRRKFGTGLVFRQSREFDLARFKESLSFSTINFLGVLSNRIDVVMLSMLVDVRVLAPYAFAANVSRALLGIRNQLQLLIFRQYINKVKGRYETVKQSIFLGISALVLCVLCYFVLDIIAVYLNREVYTNSITFLPYMLSFPLVQYIILPFSSDIQINSNKRTYIGLLLLMSVINILANLILYDYFGLLGFAYSTSIVSFSMLFGVLFVWLKTNVK